jgi:phenylacetate-CoA ligase
LGINPAKDLKIRKITVAGEPGGSVPSTKKRMEAAWGAKVYDHIGATEWGAWSFECDQQPGGLHIIEPFYLIEIEDLETGEPVTAPGKEGRMIITALEQTGKPCIRFDSKDVIQWADYRCDCNRTFRIVDGGVIGRADDITKVKGVLLAPTAIEEVVRGIPGIGDEYEVVIGKKGDLDDILLKVELLPGKETGKDAVLAQLSNQLRLKTNLGYRIETHPFDSLPRYEVKARRFKDLRKKEA